MELLRFRSCWLPQACDSHPSSPNAFQHSPTHQCDPRGWRKWMPGKGDETPDASRWSEEHILRTATKCELLDLGGRTRKARIEKRTGKAGKSSGRGTDKLCGEEFTRKLGQNNTQEAPGGKYANFLVSTGQLSFLRQCRPVEVCCHREALSCNPKPARAVLRAAGAAGPRQAAGGSPLTSPPRLACQQIPCTASRLLGAAIPFQLLLPGCHISPVSRHTPASHCGRPTHETRPRVGRSCQNTPEAGQEILSSTWTRTNIPSVSQSLPVLPATLDLLDSKPESVILSGMTEMPIVNSFIARRLMARDFFLAGN